MNIFRGELTDISAKKEALLTNCSPIVNQQPEVRSTQGVFRLIPSQFQSSSRGLSQQNRQVFTQIPVLRCPDYRDTMGPPATCGFWGDVTSVWWWCIFLQQYRIHMYIGNSKNYLGIWVMSAGIQQLHPLYRVFHVGARYPEWVHYGCNQLVRHGVGGHVSWYLTSCC